MTRLGLRLSILVLTCLLVLGCSSGQPASNPTQSPDPNAPAQAQPQTTANVPTPADGGSDGANTPNPGVVPAAPSAPTLSELDKVRTALATKLDDPTLWERLAFESAQGTRSDSVGWAVERALLLNPKSVKALRAKATACFANSSKCAPANAVSALEQALALAPNDRDVTMELARAYTLAKLPDKALPLYNQLVGLDHSGAAGARRMVESASAADLTGDGKAETLQVIGSTVKVIGGDGINLLSFDVPGTQKSLEAKVVYLRDQLPSLLVTRADDTMRADYVFSWSSREGRLVAVFQDVSRGGLYDPYRGWLVKSMRIGPTYDSGVAWAFQDGKMTQVGGMELIGSGTGIPRSATVKHLETLLGTQVTDKSGPPAWADPAAWLVLQQSIQPFLGEGSPGFFLFNKGTEEQYLLVAILRGKIILTGNALVKRQPDGVRLTGLSHMEPR